MRDIRQYLHLYIGCDVYVFPDDTYSDGWLSNRLKEMPDLQYKIQLTHENFNHIVERGYKPLLRPLSSMTVEEKFVIFPKMASSKWGPYSSDEFAKLLSKGFDLFDLIPNGLAIAKQP